MITVIQFLCIALFLIGWVGSGFWLYNREWLASIAFAGFALASYYAYTLAGASLPKPQP